MQVYNLWKEGDGNQRLELVARDWLELFREIMQNPEWKKHLDLIFRPIFDGRVFDRAGVHLLLVGAHTGKIGARGCII